MYVKYRRILDSEFLGKQLSISQSVDKAENQTEKNIYVFFVTFIHPGWIINTYLFMFNCFDFMIFQQKCSSLVEKSTLFQRKHAKAVKEKIYFNK